MDKWIDEDARRLGFNWIMLLANQLQKPENKMIEYSFKEHPFGLPMYRAPRSDYKMPIKYLRQGGRFLVVEYMPIMVAREIYLHMGSDPLIIGLRVINSQCVLAKPSLHVVCYEAATKNNVYMIEGATDCSGHGSSCKEHLDGLFALLSSMWDIKIETVEIPYHRAERIRKSIRNILFSNYER